MCSWPVMPRCLETTSTQSRGASITPLDQKRTSTVWCPGQWRARHGRPCHVPRQDDFDAGPVQAWFTQLIKTAQGIKQSASPGGPSRPGRKPPILPKPSITPSAKRNFASQRPRQVQRSWLKSCLFQRPMHRNLGIPPV